MAALAVAGLALGGSLLRAPQQQQPPSYGQAAPVAPGAPQGAAAGGGPVAAAESGAEKRAADESEAAGLSKHTDKKALAYFEGHKAAKRVKDIRIVGGYLRIYTDLPESAGNSKQALKLCETGVSYLVGELGVSSPVVFVQAKFGENGNPVLANILGPGDSDCRVTHPRPGG
ncbi:MULTISPECIES: hypothetical protein [Streptosporangium]|uniref:Uncharacterized protein n=1 Tax=Streptosporangium brasiliense TaxID=47480 RepID=A0ABT9RBN2_9ACTN|nr:hypothetical protein [Streptosporangium brasiliense]MDP9866673.1 hypothetical protein [Streptosporangium brasiliense]